MSACRTLGRSKIWGRGYTTIPITVRLVLGASNGDELEWCLTDTGDIVIKNVRRRGG